MRSSGWQYVGCILVSIGGALSIAGSIVLLYLQKIFINSIRYSAYYPPMIFGGVIVIVAGTIALIISTTKKESKTQGKV